MVFINESGYVVNIANAVPEPGVPDQSLTVYQSDAPVLFVLEINSGICAEKGIIPGTKVSIEIIKGN